MMNRVLSSYRLFASLALLLGVATGLEAYRAHAYVLPSEQVLQFMAAHFSKFDTVVVKHSVVREGGEEVGAFEEILTMKSPDQLHSEAEDPSVNQKRVVDRSYRRLFLASTEGRVWALLSWAGVDTEKVSLTRVDGTIAYLIGDQRPESPRLAVEKARFLPLLFVYPSRLAGTSALIHVMFRDYRQVAQGWYPFEILCSSADGWVERYTIQSVKVNVPVQPSVFLQTEEAPPPAEAPVQDEKINAIIKTFEEKYGR